MMHFHGLTRKTPIALLLGMAFGTAHAQQAEPEMARIEVTGSRIPSINTDGPSPITVVTAKDIKTPTTVAGTVRPPTMNSLAVRLRERTVSHEVQPM